MLGSPDWLRWPRRTARLRFTAVYAGLFLVSGIALVAVTYALFERATEYRQPQLPQIPHTPAIHDLPQQFLALPPSLAQTLPQVIKDQYRLSQDQNVLARNLKPVASSVGPGGNKLELKGVPSLTVSVPRLEKDQHQLTQDQHQLAQVERELVAAVHQISRAGSAEAAQRAADSHQLLIDSGIALAIVAVLALLVGWLVAGRMLRPIRLITRTARRISSASLHERLALDGPPDELKELGDTLDALFDRLEASFEAQRQFAANASHELRTPLARQRALIQVALADPEASFASLRAAHERVLASEQHLEAMIDALLALTRGQAGLERRERLDLEDVVSQALLAREADLAGHGLEVRATLDTAPIVGDPRLLERLIANLIDNSIRHNAPGGQIEIATETREGGAFLSIANGGPVIAPDQIERLFEPFQRLTGGRTAHTNGHGLGLSIVQAIADAHGAELIARARAQGGLVIEIAFPPPAATAAPGATRAAAPSQRVGP